ncbi:hypothetical protein F0L74_29720 [Chitinophaga agrisoli]|uniref:Uncharacterized protein n=1 Tax=Chitinophaga agrisoli TaxID=2607653 RepID=A0A5B2VNP1_9BACT|nr:hypothetical protein [Chitinophaga agrisoli]KAA2240338.1 hypothetical protein F0L74_29720 [Chitinophaga agrisoli]
MKCILWIAMLMFASYSCIAQQNDSLLPEPIDLLAPSPPFAIVVNNRNIILPDSLGGKDSRGIAALAILIDSAGNFKGINIKKLAVETLGKKIIDFVDVQARRKVMKADAYPAAVARYHPFLVNIISHAKIKRNRSVRVEPVNEIILAVRLGSH